MRLLGSITLTPRTGSISTPGNRIQQQPSSTRGVWGLKHGASDGLAVGQVSTGKHCQAVIHTLVLLPNGYKGLLPQFTLYMVCSVPKAWLKMCHRMLPPFPPRSSCGVLSSSFLSFNPVGADERTRPVHRF